MNLTPETVFMVCLSDETGKKVNDCLKRISSSMSAIYTYMDKCCELDENAPDFMDKLGPILSRMIETQIAIYPNGPEQMENDIKSIGDFTVTKIDDLKSDLRGAKA